MEMEAVEVKETTREDFFWATVKVVLMVLSLEQIRRAYWNSSMSGIWQWGELKAVLPSLWQPTREKNKDVFLEELRRLFPYGDPKGMCPHDRSGYGHLGEMLFNLLVAGNQLSHPHGKDDSFLRMVVKDCNHLFHKHLERETGGLPRLDAKSYEDRIREIMSSFNPPVAIR